MSPPKPLPSQILLREYLNYTPETGSLVWIKCSKYQQRKLGKEFGTETGDGYRVGNFLGTRYAVNRLIWVWMTGDDPGELIVDHENWDRSDNRWENLRLFTHRENAEHRKDGLPSRRTLQDKYISPQDCYFRVQVKRGGVLHRKLFKTLDEARVWRDALLTRLDS